MLPNTPQLLPNPRNSSALVATLAYEAFVTEASAGTTITYPGVSFGPAFSNRVIAVIAACRSGVANMHVTAMTIGGISATQAPGAAGLGASTQGGSDIWYAVVPSGTTGSIVVTWDNATTATGIQVYSIPTSTPAPTSGNGAASAATTSINTTITVPTNGVGISGVYLQSAGPATFTNATKDNDGAMTGGRYVGAGHTTGAGLTLITATMASAVAAMSSAAWGP